MAPSRRVQAPTNNVWLQGLWSRSQNSKGASTRLSDAWQGHMGARPSIANRRERHLQAVQFGSPENLAGEARGAPGDGQHVELAFLLVGGRRQPRHPVLADVDVA